MFGQYKRLRNEWVGILTGKGCAGGPFTCSYQHSPVTSLNKRRRAASGAGGIARIVKEVVMLTVCALRRGVTDSAPA